jgi:hypothetical protein
VDLACASRAIKEANSTKHINKSTLLASPVHGDLDILVIQSRQVTVRAIGGRPQEQADQPPGRAVTEAANQLLGLGVAGQRDGDARIDHAFSLIFPQQIPQK